MDQRACTRLETADGESVNLLGVKLTGDLRGLMFEASVEQRFCNSAQKNIEVVYSFPLPWGAVLLGVDVVLGGKRLTGAVVEKKQAEAQYEEALSEGDAAIMLERNHDHSYTLNLGNLAAGEHCAITLRYAQTLQFEQGGLRLLIPTVIAPRYGDAQQDGGLMPHQTPSHSLTADYPFELELRLHGELAHARVASPSHPVSVAHGNSEQGTVLTVSLARRASLDRDFVLVADQLAHNSIATVARDCVQPGKVAMLASFCPRIPTQGSLSTAVKILVDCSGSMAGDSIEAAKRALQAIAGQMKDGDRFSLSRFGSHVEHRSRGLWKASAATRRAAHQWVQALEADLGGTEMQAALVSTFALAQTIRSDVLLVTDGEIEAIDGTIASAKNSGHRLFIVGIGSSPAETHLRRLAEATGGACDFVAPGEAVEPAVLRMFARLRSPRLTRLSLQWPEGVTPEWVSPLSPAVFDGDTVNVFALLEAAPAGQVLLLGKRSGDGTVEQIGAADLPVQLESSDALPRMAALVRFSCAGNKAVTGQPVDTTRLAIDYQLVTGKTNFLLVHQRAEGEKATDMPALAKVAQMVPAGWGGTGKVKFAMASSVLETPDAFSGSRILRMTISPSDRLYMEEVSKQFAVSHEQTEAKARRKLKRSRSDKLRSLADGIEGQSDQIVEHQEPPRWVESEHCYGMTPFELAEWLRVVPASDWPTTYMHLRVLGLYEEPTDWLELVMSSYAGTTHTECKVVEAFLYLMSRPAIHRALAKSVDMNGVFKSAAPQISRSLARKPAARWTDVDMTLVKAMADALDGMTASTWPERVFSLDGASGETSDVRKTALIA